VAEVIERQFRAMGGPARVVLSGVDPQVADDLQSLVQDLESKWSRFLDHSEISALNRLAGRVCGVSPETFELVQRAAVATDATGGRFNPLMLDQLEHWGYRKPWGQWPTNETKLCPPATAENSSEFSSERSHGGGVAPGPANPDPILCLPEVSAIRLPPGVRLDPGGIGKGLAVDFVVEAAQAAGATTVLVELGGDLRVFGEPWYGSEWRVDVADPFDRTRNIATFTPTSGAVTTSTTLRRSWRQNGKARHHLLDPATGAPSQTDLVSVTTCSGEAWWAEVVAKVALMAGSARVVSILDSLETPGMAVTAEGRIITNHSGPGSNNLDLGDSPAEGTGSQALATIGGSDR